MAQTVAIEMFKNPWVLNKLQRLDTKGNRNEEKLSLIRVLVHSSRAKFLLVNRAGASNDNI